MQRIKGYHAHIYFDASTIDQARKLCESAAAIFPVRMGRLHERPVGPLRTGAASWRSTPSTLAWRCRGWRLIATGWWCSCTPIPVMT